MNIIKKIFNTFFFLIILFTIDLFLTQLYLFNFLQKKLEKQYVSDLKNRIPNKYYKYTFKEKSVFKSNYIGNEYTIKTNNLGFRDYKVRDLDNKKKYAIVIGDSYVEGVALEYEDTLVAHLNQKIIDNKIKNYEFLNAGVSSYSPYIYKRKVISVLENNNWLKVDYVILLLDKSDISDELNYINSENRPEYFPEIKQTYNFKYNEDFFDDLKKMHLWRFITKQTTTGSFLKKIGDILDLERRNIRDRYKLSKKLDKSFFEITSKQVRSFRSINTRRHYANYFHGNLWETKGKKSLNFSVQNIDDLKNYLNKKRIKLLVVIFPWPFEIVNKIPRENYTKYTIKSLEEKKIKYVSAYNHFLKGDVYSKISDYYIYNDMHFNGEGNKVLGNIIWEEYKKTVTSKD